MKSMKKLLSLLLAVMMIITMLPTQAFASSAELYSAGEASVVSETDTDEKEADSVLTDMVFSGSKIASMYQDCKWQLSPNFDPETKEYTVIVPVKSDEVDLWVDFSDKYPDATAKAEYKWTGSTIDRTMKKNLKAGEGVGLSRCAARGEYTNTITLTVNSNDESNITEVYTIHVKREESIYDVDLKDTKDDEIYRVIATDLRSHKVRDIEVPDDVVLEVSQARGYNTNSIVEISGVVDGKLTPKWENGIYEYTVKITSPTEGVLPVTYTGRLISSSRAAFYIDKAPDKTEYKFGEKFDPTGMVVKYRDGGKEEILDISDLTLDPNRALNENDKNIIISYKGMNTKQKITVSAMENFKGEGTEENPYLLENADDCENLSLAVSTGKTYENTYFKITDNITLPEDWVPIGSLLDGNEYDPGLSSHYYSYFSGHIDGANPDGGNYLLTVPRGGKTLLGCVIDGSLSNLDIYGERIDGYGVMEHYVRGRQYGTPAIDITNVNLKSGTHTKMSGFLGGFASGSNTVNITNCTIEEGVVIGDDGSWGDELDKTYGYPYIGTVQYNDMVGSFGGAFNGNIVNCKSYATVYGHNYVGGLIGFKGQSMGDCIVENCEFAGKVIATGDYAGGIIGSGYSADSAPNTPCVTVQNCLVSGSVTGNNMVGGILGGNPKTVDCWNNGIGYLRANLVTGTVTAKAEDALVGGIVGYIKAVNKYNIIKNNYYVEGIADKGIAKIDVVNEDNVYCETQAISKSDLTNGKAVKLLNSAKAGINPWKQGTDSPALNESNRIYKVVLSTLNGMIPSAFQSNNGYNSYITDGGDLTAYYKDGSKVTIPVVDGVTIGPDFNITETQSTQLCSVMYDGYEHFFGITIVNQKNLPLEEQQMKAVKLNILGDTVHEVTDGNSHSYADGNLVEWLGETTIMVPQDATALDVIEKAAKAYGISYELSDSQYGKLLESMSFNDVTLDSESNKQADGNAYCGWQINLNDKLMSTGLDKATVKDGDTLTVYFEDDMRDKPADKPTDKPVNGTTPDNGANDNQNGAASNPEEGATPDNGGNANQSGVAQTGDDSQIMLWAVVAIAAAGTMLVARKKRNEK